ncbi:MAG: hypothetical protein K0S76_789 [Herbinix sp.]|jgi:spore germination cell wall hydrolase CwlJ-like protein|nr:hypothetical protein [Herbinix sp.]
MLTTKRILITFLVTLLLTLASKGTAFASELDPSAMAPGQEMTTEDDIVAYNTGTEGNIDDAQDELIISNTDNTDTVTNDLQEQSDDLMEEQITLQEDGTYKDAQGQLYVIDYVDEQGQVNYKLVLETDFEDSEIEQEVTDQDEVEIEVKETEVEETEVKDTEVKVEKKEEVKKEEPVAKKPSYSEKELRLLASLIYAEAGNQSYNGMLGVANVVLNRVHSDIYGHVNTIAEVIYDKKWSVQFAVTIKSKKTGESALGKALKFYDTVKAGKNSSEIEKTAMQKAIKAAKAALEGKNNIGSYLCFQNVRSAKSIKKKYSDYKIIGDHIFYRTK